ncbi:MAG: hypothetical protein M3Y30_16345 [Gemmatimonadota bacterium]|nr:hypothetical protein [Gemmatimonadota bacterium]
MRLNAFVFALTIVCAGCSPTEVTITPPRVSQGGRAVSIAVAQSDAKRIVVASESGGLFQTYNGGVSFLHLDAFPTFAPVDVSIASLDINTIIATARRDYRTQSGGGIWRSANGGASWTRPAGWPPAITATCPDRPQAYGISHMPLTRTFYVATDCGIAVSTDNGASFSFMVLDPLRPRIRSVLVLNRSTGVASDDSTLWFVSGGIWQRASGGPISGGEFAIHGLTSPWWTGSSIFYHAGRDRAVYFSMDAGATWQEMQTLPHGGGREKVLRVGRGLDGDPTHFDVYFGDGFALWRQAVTISVPGGSNAWRRPDHVDHEDPADVAFTPGFEVPLMLASDGGVHLTPDSGRTWKLTGVAYGGFTALQIGEMTGRAVGGDHPHLDLYYGTQDNDIKGSSDGGHTWDGSIAHEGAFLQADAANPAHVDGPVTGRNCGPCTLFVVQPHLGSTANPPAFHTAPDGNAANIADPPFQLIASSYLQDVPSMAPTPSFDFFLTSNSGDNWAPAFSLPTKPLGAVKFAGDLTNPVAYIGVTGTSTVGLFRVDNVTGQATVRRADSTGILSLAQLNTGQASYTVFGVDPSNANHLLAPDVLTNTMKASTDGGLHWFAYDPLTVAVTDTGRFLVSVNGSPSVSAIAWDPTNSCHILVGTMQNGILRSTDGGLTWRRVLNSAFATYITSFFFPPTGSIWMSTYGRGLWTVNVDRRPPSSGRCAFPQPPGVINGSLDSLVVWRLDGGKIRPFGGLTDSLVCATCSIISAHDGFITDVAMDKNVVRGIAISSGMLVQRNREKRETPLPVSNSYRFAESVGLQRLVGREIIDTRRVRALVMNGTALIGIVLGGREMSFPAARTPAILIANTGGSRDPSVVLSDDSIVVRGYGFLPGTNANGADIGLDDETVAKGIEVRSDGTFTAKVPVVRGPGPVAVSATQRDGNRTTTARAVLTVAAREHDENP